MKSNIRRAEEILETLAAADVHDLVLCPGSRNSPLILTAEVAEGFQLFTHFEERAAAFFAVGRIMGEERPVAVITTSGTATAELLPATIEAYYNSLPLILVTADRPENYQGSGAPQSIEQATLFGIYAERSMKNWNKKSPFHMNICFDEPLVDQAIVKRKYMVRSQEESCSRFSERLPEETLALPDESTLLQQSQIVQDFLENSKQLLVVVSRLPKQERGAVLEFLTELKAPVYAEATSGLREAQNLKPLLIDPNQAEWDAILRIGGIPTHRLWRDLNKNNIPVCGIDHRPFSGLGRRGIFLNHAPSIVLKKIKAPRTSIPNKSLHKNDATKPADLNIYSRLSQSIPPNSNIYLGNSLPIRDWDQHATRENRRFEVTASRGANGIDGQISTFLGWAKEGEENWGIFGDLTALYDLASPWIVSQLPPEMIVRIVIINNGGGKIFSRMYDKPILENRHSFEFEHFAKLWKLDYCLWEGETLPKLKSNHIIIERMEL